MTILIHKLFALSQLLLLVLLLLSAAVAAVTLLLLLLTLQLLLLNLHNTNFYEYCLWSFLLLTVPRQWWLTGARVMTYFCIVLRVEV